MRFQNLTGHLARAAQDAMKRLQTTRTNSDSLSTIEASQQFAAIDSAKGTSENTEQKSVDATLTREQRLHAWRRRVLLKKGARLHAASLQRGDRCALAMLDSNGTVVAWYDDSKDSSRVGTHVVDRHVSQFYIAADVASNLPGLNLLSAATCGGNTQQGWRRQPRGAIIWSTTVIEAIVLKDGRLQGFSHIVRPAEGPRAGLPNQLPLPSLQASGGMRWGMERTAMVSRYAGAAA